MKATGIVRRIDDLGRVVIPKEIRRQMRIREGDPLEIFTDGNKVCFERYNPIDTEKWETALRIAKVMLPNTNFALLNRYGEVEKTNSDKSMVTIRNDYISAEIRVEGELEGYVQSLESDASNISFTDTAKVISALFAEEG
jgi:AbrB family looped-hinge helix DNA binding protein